jgi:hypothetical protein
MRSSCGVLLDRSTEVTYCLFFGDHCQSLQTLRVGAWAGTAERMAGKQADLGRMYFRSLPDPTPVMLQRLAVPAFSALCS